MHFIDMLTDSCYSNLWNKGVNFFSERLVFYKKMP
jgi:hypothetical protein